MVIAIASHECEEIGDIYLGDTLSTDTSFQDNNDTTEDFVVASDKTIKIASYFLNITSVILPAIPTDPDSSDITITDYTVAGRILTFADSSLIGQSLIITYRKGYVSITKYLGTLTQTADPDLMANAKDTSGNNAWTEDHTLTGRAYIVARLEYNTTVFPQGIPNIKAVVKGVNSIYDPRTSTTGYSENAALCMRDYLAKSYGLRCQPEDINDPSFISGANICDESVPVIVGTGAGYVTDASFYDVGRTILHLASGTGTILAGDVVTVTVVAGTYTVAGVSTEFSASSYSYTVEVALDSGNLLTLAGNGLIAAIPPIATTVNVSPTNFEPRYTCNGSFTLDGKPVDIIKKMLTACAGRLVWSQGQYSLWTAAYNYPVVTLTESDLRDDISIAPAPSRRQRFNTVRGTFVFPAQYWQQIDFPYQQDAATYANDNNEELCQNLELPYTISSATAQRLANIFLQQNLFGCVVTFPAKLTAFRLQPGDVVRLSIAQLKWVNKEFRVQDWQLSDSGGVDLTLREESASIYGWITSQQTIPRYPPAAYISAPNQSLPVYADNASALAAGMSVGQQYRTSDGIVHVVY